MRARVLWLIKGLGLGGAERLLTLATPYLDRSRFEYQAAYLLPWKNALVDELQRAGVPVTCLNHRRAFDLRIVGRIAALLRERRIDLVHLHLPYAGIVGRLAARLAGVPCVVYTEHNLQARYHPLTRMMNQLTMRLTDVTISVSEEVRRSLVMSPLGRGAKVETVLNGVDVDGLQLAAVQGPSVRDELAIPPEHRIVGVVNVFRPQKRLDLWLQAARLVADQEPQTTFVIVGDGPIRADLMEMADRLGLRGTVIFPGLRHDAPRFLAAFDVFMLSSVYEGLPVAVLEAMALQTPVVATQVGGLPGVIEEGVQGFLVPPRDPEALADRVVRLLRDPDLRRRQGEAARQRVQERFSIDRMVAATEQIYTQLLAVRACLDHQTSTVSES